MANLNATLYNNPTINENNIEFDGNTQYAETQNTTTIGFSKNTKFTMELRFMINDTNSNNGILNIYESSNNRISLMTYGGSNYLYASIYAHYEVISFKEIAQIEPRVIYTIAIVRDETHFHIYLDGILIVSYANEDSYDYDCKIKLGEGRQGTTSSRTNYMRGKIYAFRYYHGRALTTAEIESNAAVDRQRLT